MLSTFAEKKNKFSSRNLPCSHYLTVLSSMKCKGNVCRDFSLCENFLRFVKNPLQFWINDEFDRLDENGR